MNNPAKIMLTSIIAILFIVATAVIIILYIYILEDDKGKGDAMTIDEVVEYSYETPEITTDLEDGSFVRIQFQIVTDGKKARKEIDLREFQIKNILIKELAQMDEKDFKSGLEQLEKDVQSKLNEVMIDGEVTGVYTINKILQ